MKSKLAKRQRCFLQACMEEQTENLGGMRKNGTLTPDKKKTRSKGTGISKLAFAKLQW
jgi:hypothetical protein